MCFSGVTLSCVQFQKAFVYGELLLNEMWRKYLRGNSTSKNELIETLVDLFAKLQRFELLHCSLEICHCFSVIELVPVLWHTRSHCYISTAIYVEFSDNKTQVNSLQSVYLL